MSWRTSCSRNCSQSAMTSDMVNTAKPTCRPGGLTVGQRLSPGPVCSCCCLLPLLPSLLHPASAPLCQNAIPPWSPVWGSCFGDPHRAASLPSQASVRSCPASHSTYLTTQKRLAGHRWWLWKKCVETSHLLWGMGGRGDPHLLWGTGCGCFTLCTCWNVPSFLTGLSPCPTGRLDPPRKHWWEGLLKSYLRPSS